MNKLLILATVCWQCGNAYPRAHTTKGTLEGFYRTTRLEQTFSAFVGIPYARPPVDELRFNPPKPFGSWNGIRSAKTNPQKCTQRDLSSRTKRIIGDEDCLYLNVYTPEVPRTHDFLPEDLYPVMVFIHGGDFVTGTGNYHVYQPTYLLDNEVVLVTLNYRLGPLGFLSTEDSACYGNLGMKDQALAIKWVKENIAAFGGNRDKITIFGDGASTHFHMLRKRDFQQAISHSGTINSPRALVPSGVAKFRAQKLAEILNCPINNSTLLINCLKTKDAKDITDTDRAFQILGFLPVPQFGIVIEPEHDGAFITKHPMQLLKSGTAITSSWMVGTVSAEGCRTVAAIYGRPHNGHVDQLDKNFTKLAPIIFNYNNTLPEELQNNMSMRIREYYLNDNHIDEDTRMDLVKMFTDAFVSIPTEDSIKLQYDHSPESHFIYYYKFMYDGHISFSKIYGDLSNNYGACHNDELLYLFPLSESLMNSRLDEADEPMITHMTSIWVNFAKTGRPHYTNRSMNWIPVTQRSLNCFHINEPFNGHMDYGVNRNTKHFWASLPYKELARSNN